jgi:hypothetical protein
MATVFLVFVRAKSVTVLYKVFKTMPTAERIIEEIRKSPSMVGLKAEQIDEAIANVHKGEFRINEYPLVE